MGVLMLFALIIVVLVVLAVDYENKKKDRLNKDVHIFGKKYKVKDFQNIDINKLNKKREELQKENDRIYNIQQYYFEYVRNGKSFEENKDYYNAINQYEYGLEFAKNQPDLKIHNFYNGIQRLIILYGKTKQNDKLEKILVESINEYPDFRFVNDWKIRLEKLKSKSN